MSDIALVSADFGGIDDMKPVPPHDGVECLCFTDDATLAETPPGVLGTWTRVSVPQAPRPDYSPRLRARYIKHQMHRLSELRDQRWLIWMDASLQIVDPRFLQALPEQLAAAPPKDRILLVPHPDRKTIREEYEFICHGLDLGDAFLSARYSKPQMTDQMAYFRGQGWNLDAPLYCSGFFLVENTAPFHRLLDDWWNHDLKFGMMDQLSLPVLLAHHGCKPQLLQVNIFNNQYWSFHPHKK